MQVPVFEKAYLLQSIGWAIANSFWQTGLLWLLYQCITTIDKKLPALVKYYLSLVLLTISFTWFCFTIVKNYGLLTNNFPINGILLPRNFIGGLNTVNHLLPFISIVYLALLCYYAVQYIRHLSANRFLQQNGLKRAPIDFRLFTTYTATTLGIKKKIQVWLSAHVDVPSVTGFFKPVILLPAAIVSQLSVQQIEAILLHELAHIRRNDYLVNLLQSMVEQILFFNPFARLLSKTAKTEREYCCDEWVINFKYNQHEYANALLILEEHRQLQPLTFALAATNGKKNLLLRVKRLFSNAPQTTVSVSQKLKLAVLSFLLLLGIFALNPFFTNNLEEAEAQFSEANDKIKKINLPLSPKQREENYSGTILTSPIIKSISAEKPLAGKKMAKKHPPIEPVEEYVNAFINEELLNTTSQEAPIPSLVMDKEIDNSTYIIKLEEQQSGNKETTTYYFELNNQEGNTEIKPLIIFNKQRVTGKKKVKEHLPDSTVGPKKLAAKKRISS